MKTILSKVLPIILISLLYNCNGSKDNNSSGSLLKTGSLELIAVYNVGVTEPSGLCLSSDGKNLFTVSDNYNRIYMLSLTGEVLDSVEVHGYDFEGISKHKDNGLILICERDREVVSVDSNYRVTQRKKLGLKGDLNSGLEGIVYDHNNQTFVLNEKDPALLLKLDEELTIVDKFNLDYADDYSGMDYDSSRKELWLISDEDSKLFRSDTTGRKINEYNFDIRQAEGIAINFPEKLIYIISDYTQKLYVFRYPE